MSNAPLQIDLQALTPFGVIAQAQPDKAHAPRSLSELNVATLGEWIAQHKLVVLRGFEPLSTDGLMAFARRFGPLLRWEFGEVLNLKVEENPKNHLFRGGRVEMHWDGAYLTEVPPYSLFQCLQSSQTEQGGETLFTHTPRVVERALTTTNWRVGLQRAFATPRTRQPTTAATSRFR